MIKQILLLGIAGCLSLSSSAVPTSRSALSNPLVIDWNAPIEHPLYPKAIVSKIETSPNAFFAPKYNAPFKDAEDGASYFVAAQRYFRGYNFAYEGGDVSTYNMTVKVDGETVTLNGLFNLAAQSTEWNVFEDYEVVGTYNKDKGTLTIPTNPNFNEGTIVGSAYGGYYQELLIAGTVTESREIETVDELVFTVIGDFEAITTETSFGIMNCTSTGDMYGMGDLYRGFYATLPQREPKLITFGDEMNIGEEFTTMSREGAVTVVNVSDAEVNYSAELESDGGVFSLTEEIGTVNPLTAHEINIVFSPTEPGSYSAKLTVEYEGVEEDPEPLSVTCLATGVAMPDFDKIVKNGSFSFQTNIDYPFYLETLANGTVVAMSSCSGKGYVSSLFTVEFEVPEDNIATFSWKGEVCMEIMNNAAAGYYIDGSDYPAVTLYESDNIDNSIEFGPGKHSIRYEYYNANNSGSEEYFMYLYDLDLITIEAEKEAVSIDNANITLPNQLIKDDMGVVASGCIDVRNMGATPITISSITLSDTEHFSADVPKEEATLFEVLPVNVNFATNEPGQYSTQVEITTNCGTVSAEVKVLVRKMADFSSVVVKGLEYVTSIETSDTDPFDVKDGVAFNANTGMNDDIATTSWFQINFTIPEGCEASIAWDGEIDGGEYDSHTPFNMDYGFITIYNSTTGYWSIYTNEYEGNASSTLFSDVVDGFARALEFGPGAGFVKFEFLKNGDGKISDVDMMQISDFSIITEDSGINNVKDNVIPVSTEMYNINGISLQETQKGINIMRITYSDGSVKIRKVIVK